MASERSEDATRAGGVLNHVDAGEATRYLRARVHSVFVYTVVDVDVMITVYMNLTRTKYKCTSTSVQIQQVQKPQVPYFIKEPAFCQYRALNNS